MMITEVREVTPARVAARVTGEDDLMWRTVCERAGCGNPTTAPKIEWSPVDPRHPATTGYVEIRYAAPGARWCADHPPTREELTA